MVDAAQGVEAQTVANVHLAAKQDLTIVPVINKIDLPNANVEETKRQLEEILAIPADYGDSGQREDGHRDQGHFACGHRADSATKADRREVTAGAGV